MSGSFSEYAAGKILQHALGVSAWSIPTVYLALCTVVPTSASTGATITEATYTGYARVALAGTWGSVITATPCTLSNSVTVTFPACTGGTSTIVGYAILDGSTLGAGNIIGWGSVTSTVVSTTNTPATFAISALEVELTAS